MKLRIKGNSIRYRLSQSDVCRFLETGHVAEETNFGHLSLIYQLSLTKENNLFADLKNNTITAYLPEEMALTWNESERIGYDGTYNNLYILIEKDFQCLDNTIEDQSDNYPNPLLKC